MVFVAHLMHLSIWACGHGYATIELSENLVRTTVEIFLFPKCALIHQWNTTKIDHVLNVYCSTHARMSLIMQSVMRGALHAYAMRLLCDYLGPLVKAS